jgi:DNA helicase-2/ATP-dependent DNA helicase PcrA
MTEPIAADILSYLQNEESILTEAIRVIQSDIVEEQRRFNVEDEKARTLTAELVAIRRAEEKVQTVSDEAIAHSRTKLKKEQIKTLNEMLASPYFARVEIEERGKVQEFKVSTFANSNARIIDWRQAPLSKLFYEYREGDEYEEEILGRERSGKVLLRNTYDIKEGTLKKVTCRFGVFAKNDDGSWKCLGAKQEFVQSSGGNELLSLISPEQFNAITQDATSAVIIQGVAGSGKTTVGLHRLSWLIKHNLVDAAKAKIVVPSEALKAFIGTFLEELELEGIKIYTLQEFTLHYLSAVIPEFTYTEVTPSSVRRFLLGEAMLESIEKVTSKAPPLEQLDMLLSNPRELLNNDPTKLLSSVTIEEARRLLKEGIAKKDLPGAFAFPLLRLVQRSGSVFEKLEHLFVDEAQNLTPVELAATTATLRSAKDLTLVGDRFQRLSEGSYPTWEHVRKALKLSNDESSLLSLSISFRSTKQIISCANAIVGEAPPQQGREGRAPLWVAAGNESRGIGAAISWLSTASTKYPSDRTAVIVSSPAEIRTLVSLLTPKLGNLVRSGSGGNFSFDAGVIVTSIDQVPGLEFTNVLVFGAHKVAPSLNSGEDQKRLYLAATRAIENLAIISWGGYGGQHRINQYIRQIQQ